MVNGYAEIIKYAFIMDSNLFQIVKNNLKKLYIDRDLDLLKQIISLCMEHKMNIVEQDLKDNNIRRILNFGHTIGHALESYSKFKLSHGLAVFHGMKAALYISNKLNTLTIGNYHEALKLINSFNIKWVKIIHPEKVLEFIDYDKKISNNKLNFILLEKIGKAYINNNVSKDIIIESMKNI